MSNFAKVAEITVKDGTYEKQGREYARYQNVGCLFSTPHGSRMFIKLNATATSEARILNISPDTGVKISVEQPQKEEEGGAAPPEF